MISSEINSRDNSSIHFEILGKYKGYVFIYKNISRDHYLVKYDDSMRIVETIQLDFIPEKVFNLDFISYPNKFHVIYQYQRNNIVYCNAVKLTPDGIKSGEILLLDTTKVGYFADNKIYSTTFSEDKKRILVYKQNIRNGTITIASKVFDDELFLQDSARQVFDYDDRSELYSGLSIDNEGNLVYAKSTEIARGKDGVLDIFMRKHKVDSLFIRQIPLTKKYSEDVFIKADNINKRFVLCAFCYTSRKRYLDGLFSASFSVDNINAVNTAYNRFSDSLRNPNNADYKYSFDYANLAIKNLILKKNGGFIVLSEDYYNENIAMGNGWNRGMFNTMPFFNMQDYYLFNQYYGYMPFNNTGFNQSIRYYSNDIVVANIDSALNLSWNTIIRKKQLDVDNQNFLSYSTLNAGSELRFFFLERDRTRQTISSQGLFPDGELRRYPTIKGTDSRYEFMPRLAKQVGSATIIVPFLYLGKIGFAKIEY
ncbi:MAG: hypothetical protein FGM46_04955 [Ferruginibacter sp.]|nr:hypothetical protein [Ferruginibacter sp.]